MSIRITSRYLKRSPEKNASWLNLSKKITRGSESSLPWPPKESIALIKQYMTRTKQVLQTKHCSKRKLICKENCKQRLLTFQTLRRGVSIQTSKCSHSCKIFVTKSQKMIHLRNTSTNLSTESLCTSLSTAMRLTKRWRNSSTITKIARVLRSCSCASLPVSTPLDLSRLSSVLCAILSRLKPELASWISKIILVHSFRQSSQNLKAKIPLKKWSSVQMSEAMPTWVVSSRYHKSVGQAKAVPLRPEVTAQKPSCTNIQPLSILTSLDATRSRTSEEKL